MPKRNLEPGMDDAQLDKDRAGWKTTVENVTGGTMEALGEDAGMEVGNPYENDPLGEERSIITHTENDPAYAKPGKGLPRPQT